MATADAVDVLPDTVNETPSTATQVPLKDLIAESTEDNENVAESERELTAQAEVEDVVKGFQPDSVRTLNGDVGLAMEENDPLTEKLTSAPVMDLVTEPPSSVSTLIGNHQNASVTQDDSNVAEPKELNADKTDVLDGDEQSPPQDSDRAKEVDALDAALTTNHSDEQKVDETTQQSSDVIVDGTDKHSSSLELTDATEGQVSADINDSPSEANQEDIIPTELTGSDSQPDLSSQTTLLPAHTTETQQAIVEDVDAVYEEASKEIPNASSDYIAAPNEATSEIPKDMPAVDQSQVDIHGTYDQPDPKESALEESVAMTQSTTMLELQAADKVEDSSPVEEKESEPRVEINKSTPEDLIVESHIPASVETITEVVPVTTEVVEESVIPEIASVSEPELTIPVEISFPEAKESSVESKEDTVQDASSELKEPAPTAPETVPLDESESQIPAEETSSTKDVEGIISGESLAESVQDDIPPAVFEAVPVVEAESQAPVQEISTSESIEEITSAKLLAESQDDTTPAIPETTPVAEAESQAPIEEISTSEGITSTEPLAESQDDTTPTVPETAPVVEPESQVPVEEIPTSGGIDGIASAESLTVAETASVVESETQNPVEETSAEGIEENTPAKPFAESVQDDIPPVVPETAPVAEPESQTPAPVGEISTSGSIEEITPAEPSAESLDDTTPGVPETAPAIEPESQNLVGEISSAQDIEENTPEEPIPESLQDDTAPGVPKTIPVAEAESQAPIEGISTEDTEEIASGEPLAESQDNTTPAVPETAPVVEPESQVSVEETSTEGITEIISAEPLSETPSVVEPETQNLEEIASAEGTEENTPAEPPAEPSQDGIPPVVPETATVIEPKSQVPVEEISTGEDIEESTLAEILAESLQDGVVDHAVAIPGDEVPAGAPVNQGVTESLIPSDGTSVEEELTPATLIIVTDKSQDNEIEGGPAHPAEIERPKSPWTPSYSVLNQGPGIPVEDEQEQPLAVAAEPQLQFSQTDALPEGQTISRPVSPWTPSYSVSRQGSPLPETKPLEVETVTDSHESDQQDDKLQSDDLITAAPSEEQVKTEPNNTINESVPDLSKEGSEQDKSNDSVTAVTRSEQVKTEPIDIVTESIPTSDPPKVEPEQDKSDDSMMAMASNEEQVQTETDYPNTGKAETTPALGLPSEQTAAITESLEEATVEQDVPQNEAVTSADDNTSANLDVERIIERPKSPWTPSYSVTSQGPGIINEEDIPQIDPLPSATVETESAPVIVEPAPLPHSEKSVEVETSRPSSPWTPSYSTSVQGGLNDVEEAPKDVRPTVVEQFPSEGKQEAESRVQADTIAADQVVTVSESFGTVEGKEPEQVSSKATPHEMQEIVDAVDDVQISSQAEPEAVDEVPQKQEDALSNGETPIERPKSPWTPSYSVTQQGSSEIQPAQPAPSEEKQIEHHVSSIAISEEASSTLEPKDVPERPWTPSYSVFSLPGSDTTSKVKEPEESTPEDASGGDVKAAESTAEAQTPLAETTELPAPQESKQAFPTTQANGSQESLTSLDTVEPKDSTARARLESTTSSLFFPGGWFSKTPPATLDTSQGQGIFTTPTSPTSPTGPQVSKVPETSATSADTISPEDASPTSLGETGADEKKSKWCIVM